MSDKFGLGDVGILRTVMEMLDSASADAIRCPESTEKLIYQIGEIKGYIKYYVLERELYGHE